MKSSKIAKYVLCLILVFTIVSCKKGGTGNSENPGEIENDEGKVPVTIYIVGTEYTPGPVVDGNQTLRAKIKCWKNDVSLNFGGAAGEGSGIAISGDDLYIACTIYQDAGSPGSITRSSGYFKNDKMIFLSQPISNALGITVNNNDVYVCGYDRSKGLAVYWKNGNVIRLASSNAGRLNTSANSIAVVDNDIYVAGNESNGTYAVAIYWKNGTAINLSNGNNDAYARAIAVSGNDVYVAGSEKVGLSFVAKLWKNGIAANLSNGSNDTRANAIAVVGDDVYIAGTESIGTSDKARYWKNGKLINLGNGSATGISIINNSVYVSGYEGKTPKYWKDGVAINLPLSNNSSQGTANAILVVPER